MNAVDDFVLTFFFFFLLSSVTLMVAGFSIPYIAVGSVISSFVVSMYDMGVFDVDARMF